MMYKSFPGVKREKMLGPFVRVSLHGKRKLGAQMRILLQLNLLLNPQVLVYRNKTLSVLEEGGGLRLGRSSLLAAASPKLSNHNFQAGLEQTEDRVYPGVC